MNDPVEEYLTDELCDSCRYWEVCREPEGEGCRRGDEALAHYRKVLAELTHLKRVVKSFKICIKHGQGVRDSLIKQLAKALADLEQAEAERDRLMEEKMVCQDAKKEAP